MEQDLTTTSLVTSAQSMAPLRSQLHAAKTQETKVVVLQVAGPAPVPSQKSLKCCVRCSIHFLKTTCFLWALPVVARVVGPALALRACLFLKGLFFLRICPWKWKHFLKMKFQKPAQCLHFQSHGEHLQLYNNHDFDLFFSRRQNMPSSITGAEMLVESTQTVTSNTPRNFLAKNANFDPSNTRRLFKRP